MTTETAATSPTSPSSAALIPQSLREHPLLRGRGIFTVSHGERRFVPIEILRLVLGDSNANRTMQWIDNAGCKAELVPRPAGQSWGLPLEDLPKWLEEASRHISAAKRVRAPAGKLTAPETILVNLGILCGRGALSEEGLREIVDTLRREGALHSALPEVQQKVKVPALLQAAEPLPKEATEVAVPSVSPLPVTEAAEGQAPEVMTPTDVVPQGYLSATGVVEVLREEDAWWKEHLRGTQDPVLQAVLRMLERGVLETYHRKVNAPVRKAAKNTPYSRNTLAKTVGDLARELGIYPLPHASSGYIPKPGAGEGLTRVYHLNKAKEADGKVVSVPVNAYALYNREAVRRIHQRALQHLYPSAIPTIFTKTPA